MFARTSTLFGLVLAFLVTPGDARQGPGSPATADFARKLVTEIGHIGEGDLVRISGNAGDAELMEEIAVAVRQLGGFPLITFTSDELARRMYVDVPERFDAQTPKFDLALAGIVTTEINVGDNPSAALAGVPPDRQATVDSAATAVASLLNARAVQQINVGNGLYPTDRLAQQFGLTRAQLDDLFWNGVNADYGAMQATGERVHQVLDGGSTVHITNDNGTDLRVSIEGRPAFLSDGIVSAEEVAMGGAARLTWLPAGEVYTTPVRGTAEGTLVVDRVFYQGQEVRDLTITFEAGLATSLSAVSGGDELWAMFEAAEEGKEEFAFIDIGVNPAVQLIPGTSLLTYVAEGMVSVGIGGNVWAGGSNNATFAIVCHIPGSTLMVDGNAVVENGTLAIR